METAKAIKIFKVGMTADEAVDAAKVRGVKPVQDPDWVSLPGEPATACWVFEDCEVFLRRTVWPGPYRIVEIKEREQKDDETN